MPAYRRPQTSDSRFAGVIDPVKQAGLSLQQERLELSKGQRQMAEENARINRLQIRAALAERARKEEEEERRMVELPQALTELSQIRPDDPYQSMKAAKVAAKYLYASSDPRVSQFIDRISTREQRLQEKDEQAFQRYGIRPSDYQAYDEAGNFLGLNYDQIGTAMRERSQRRLQEMIPGGKVVGASVNASGDPSFTVAPPVDVRDELLDAVGKGFVPADKLQELRGRLNEDPDGVRQEIAVLKGTKANELQATKSANTQANMLLKQISALATQGRALEDEDKKKIAAVVSQLEALNQGVAPTAPNNTQGEQQKPLPEWKKGDVYELNGQVYRVRKDGELPVLVNE